MFTKLLKKDLKKDMRWMWIIFVSTIIASIISRGAKEIGKNFIFFKILAIFFDSVFYSLAVNCILQPFLRSFMNFSKDFYGDESYLTHTLPVTKNELVNSKFLTALIEIVLGFLSLIVSLLIMFYSPTMFDTLKTLMSFVIIGKFSIRLVITLLVALVVVEFLMFITLILFSMVISYRSKEKRALKTFLFTTAFAFMASTILSVVMVIVLSINGVKLNTTSFVLSNSAFLSVILTGIIVYSIVIIVFYFLTKREFRKGVNVD